MASIVEQLQYEVGADCLKDIDGTGILPEMPEARRAQA